MSANSGWPDALSWMMGSNVTIGSMPRLQLVVTADTLNAGQLKKRGYFNPKKVAALIEAMNRTREFVYCKQVMSLVILELWHRAFVDKQYFFGE